MPKIKTLPDDVTRQIAAGEVVERPASVVKELLENAIDAGAQKVTVRTSGAGEDLIEVIDDGVGMSRDDILLAPANFATSKITSAADLHRIGTYGFRGEALASISAVSRFELVSSNASDGEGWRLTVEGKSVTGPDPAPCERGTTVRVRDLFFNTPARKRFLKSPITERRRILETILSFALVLPDVEFHYIDDSRHVLDVLPANNWRDRVASVLGATTMKHMVEIDHAIGDVRVRGFVSLPSFTRGNRNQQFYFVNRRFVREKTIVHAVGDAYRNVIPYKRFPITVLSVEVPAADVDVNVHPSKLEVRLRNENMAFGAIRGAIKAAMTSESEAQLAVGVGSSEESTEATARPTPDLFVNEESGRKVISLQDRLRDNFSEYTAKRPATQPSFNPSLSLAPVEPNDETKRAVEKLIEKPLADDALFWQFNNAYIFIQVRGGIVVIDQHAAHERIIFDQSKRQLADAAPVSQQILFSIHLELSLSELELFKEARAVFGKLGFDLEPFGGKSILVRGYPAGLHNWEEGKLLLQVFDDLQQDRFPGNSLEDKLVASFACRSAIKAGQALKLEEMRYLADQLFATDNPYSCPHGRPTVHRLAIEEIERWFQRR